MIRIGCGYLHPTTYVLLERLLAALYEDDLDDVAVALEQWLVSSPGVLLRVQTGSRLPAYQLSDYGELTVRELLDVAERTVLPPTARRTAIAQALVLAGYARPRA